MTTTNQTAKHTPGPWKMRPTDTLDGPGFDIDSGGGKWVASCSDPDNARLIAEAPMLLEALSNLVRQVEWIVTDGTLHQDALEHPSMVKARQAIARAEGRS